MYESSWAVSQKLNSLCWSKQLLSFCNPEDKQQIEIIFSFIYSPEDKLGLS